jgi:hypothetical protein
VLSPSYYGARIPLEVLGDFSPDFGMLAASLFSTRDLIQWIASTGISIRSSA